MLFCQGQFETELIRVDRSQSDLLKHSDPQLGEEEWPQPSSGAAAAQTGIPQRCAGRPAVITAQTHMYCICHEHKGQKCT